MLIGLSLLVSRAKLLDLLQHLLETILETLHVNFSAQGFFIGLSGVVHFASHCV